MLKYIKILALSVILTSCTMYDSVYTSSLTDDESLSQYKTFAWLPKDSASIQNTLYDNKIIESEIIKNANNELFGRGFKINTDTPDVLVRYTIMVEKREEVVNNTIATYPAGPRGYVTPYNSNAYNSTAYDTPWNLYYYSNPGNMYNAGYYVNNYPYYSPYGFPYIGGPYMVGTSSQKVTVKEGTLIIDLIDRRKNVLVWRGWGTDALPDPANFKRTLPREINEIFQKLDNPPK